MTDPTPERVHACPPEGSGVTPCCGRTPFELPLGDRISSEAPVTCPGAPVPAVVPPPDDDGEACGARLVHNEDDQWTCDRPAGHPGGHSAGEQWEASYNAWTDNAAGATPAPASAGPLRDALATALAEVLHGFDRQSVDEGAALLADTCRAAYRAEAARVQELHDDSMRLLQRQLEDTTRRAEDAEARLASARTLADDLRGVTGARYIAEALDKILTATERVPAWTPPPPGDRREQLPDHLLQLIDVPDYVSTACQTARALACDTDQPHADERNQWAARLHARCRRNQKFTGVSCDDDCHKAKEPHP